ncbi:MAG: transcription-repair coupling factor [Chitinophagaceae bacterium]|nr:transcription-repair coupling factor [Oligoflexus sp.]
MTKEVPALKTIPSLTQYFQATLDLSVRGEPVQLIGLTDAQKLYVLLGLIRYWQKESHHERLVFVHSDPKQLGFWNELVQANNKKLVPTLEIQSQQFWGFQRYRQQNHLRGPRLQALSVLAFRERSAPLIWASFSALAQSVTAPKIFRESCFQLKQGEEYDLDQLIKSLMERGFRQVQEVEEVGQFAVKGGMIDIFSPAESSAARCEFFADTLQKIKLFSVDTQLSTGETSSLWISSNWEEVFPISERKHDAQRLYDALLAEDVSSSDRQGLVDAFAEGHVLNEMPILLPALRRKSSHFFDYLEPADRLVFLESVDVCIAKYTHSYERWEKEYEEDRLQKRIVLSTDAHFLAPKLVQKLIGKRPVLEFGLNHSHAVEEQIQTSSQAPGDWHLPALATDKSSLSRWIECLEDPALAFRVILLVRQEEHFLRIRSVLQHHNLSFDQSDQRLDQLFSTPMGASITLAVGSVPGLLWDELSGVLILPEHVFFGEYFIPAPTRKKDAKNAFRSFQELGIGSLVVHSDHGIGKYLGMKTMDVGGSTTDFLVLEYADQDRLYLPVYRLGLLQKYSAVEHTESAPLDKLRSQSWIKRKSRAKKSIQDIADQLLRLHAQRRLAGRAPYSSLSDLYFQFEADFPYSETDDQQKAIDEVNADLSSDLPMDRLICGDVGFGKTEVALRAAMRVVLDGYQIMVLAPTTLLSYQHYETFARRFKPYGIEVGVANRFVKADRIKTNLERFTQGKVDIMIGTHRLLSGDVKPKNLGLLIVDEEQRFGVTHKEKLKQYKAECDIITLTATPIPRSLHMSLVGLRDISIIATPPMERLSIKTYIAQFDAELIKRAIRLEVQRGGQIFFVHNRVQDIVEMSAFLRSLVPEVTMTVAHGQMKENNVETTIVDFVQQKYSVLVCTTIIESGIDMPNVNTIIVNDADRFGLAQLYQMRGRVGRSTRQSYAYFLTKAPLASNEDARRRLEILATHQELGVGFQIASYDLELRGTGNILGGQQSGHMDDIGYEMYLDLLEKEMALLRGQEREPDVDPEIKIPLSASLSAAYVPQERQRLLLYKNLFSATEMEEVDRYRRECVDRFGNLPKEAYNLFQVASLKVLLRKMRVEQIQALKPHLFELRMSQLKEAQIKILSEACALQSRILTLTPDFKLIVNLGAGEIEDPLQRLIEVLFPLTIA